MRGIDAQAASIPIPAIELLREADQADVDVADADVEGILVEDTVGLATNPAFPVAGAAVIDPFLIGSDVYKVDLYIVEQNVIDLSRCVAADENAILGSGEDVDEADVMYRAAGTLGGAFRKTPACILVVAYSSRIRRDIDRLRLSPPYL